MYDQIAKSTWYWFEDSLTYTNSILSEAMLYAWLTNGDLRYQKIAKESFNFLLSKIFIGNSIHVIPNKIWYLNDLNKLEAISGGEQPIDVAYTILTLKQFHAVFPNAAYNEKMEGAFNWFLGDNHLNHIVYNTCTGGCYDGVEEHSVNLNQGAESTISYLLSRLAFENIEIETLHNEMIFPKECI